MDSKKTSTTTAATATDSEVRTIDYLKKELEICKKELETYKTLYWDLQVELDRVDEMRKKNDRYFVLRRQKALEKLFSGSEASMDCDCDCDGDQGFDEVDC